MVVIQICPDCGTKVETEAWVSGECPKCGKEYGFDEMVAGEDEIPLFYWWDDEI